MPPIPMLSVEQFANAQRDAANVECNRCGLCCRLPSGKDCPNLRRRPEGVTYCSIWNRAGRIGRPIGEGAVCNQIMRVPTLYKGCPYNAVKIKHGIAQEGDEEKD